MTRTKYSIMRVTRAHAGNLGKRRFSSAGAAILTSDAFVSDPPA